jgi:hypothetical protein
MDVGRWKGSRYMRAASSRDLFRFRSLGAGPSDWRSSKSQVPPRTLNFRLLELAAGFDWDDSGP